MLIFYTYNRYLDYSVNLFPKAAATSMFIVTVTFRNLQHYTCSVSCLQSRDHQWLACLPHCYSDHYNLVLMNNPMKYHTSTYKKTFIYSHST